MFIENYSKHVLTSEIARLGVLWCLHELCLGVSGVYMNYVYVYSCVYINYV